MPPSYKGYVNAITPGDDSIASSVSNTGNYTREFASVQREILFSNDADKETPPLQLDTYCTVRLEGPGGVDYSFTVYYGEVLDERLPPFNKITITANYKWRYWTRAAIP